MDARSSHEAQLLAGRYRLLAPVDSDLEGSSAWRATDQILDRPVQVRVLESGAVAPAPDAARRAALVTDPRLLRVLDVGIARRSTGTSSPSSSPARPSPSWRRAAR